MQLHNLRSRVGPLTDHERAVLELMTDGLQDKEIAARLGMTIGQIRNTTQNLRLKFNASNRTAVVARYLGGAR